MGLHGFLFVELDTSSSVISYLPDILLQVVQFVLPLKVFALEGQGLQYSAKMPGENVDDLH